MASQTHINGPVSAEPAVTTKTPKSTTARRSAAKRAANSAPGRKTASERQPANGRTEQKAVNAPWPTLPPAPEPEEAAAPEPAGLNAEDRVSADEAAPEASGASTGAGPGEDETAPDSAASASAGMDAPAAAAAASGDAGDTAPGAAPAADSRPVPDEELISLLERLSVTIDNAHQVLDEAAGINTRPRPEAMERPEAVERPEAGRPVTEPREQPAPAPGQDDPAAGVPAAGDYDPYASPVADDYDPYASLEADDYNPYASLEAEMPVSRPVWVDEAPPQRQRATSIALLVTLMIMAPVAGAGWFVYANPGLLAGTAGSDVARASTDGDARQETAVTKQATAAMIAANTSAGSSASSASSASSSGPASPGPTNPPAPAKAATPGAAADDTSTESAPLPPNDRQAPPDAEPAAVEVASLTPDTPPANQSGGGESNVIRGAAGQPIEVPLVLPPTAAEHEVSIMIEGVPEDARLTAGKSIGRGTWILNGSQAGSLALTTGADFAPERFPLNITMVKSDGKAPEVRSLDIVIEEAGSAGAASAEKASGGKDSAGTSGEKESDGASGGKDSAEASGETDARQWTPSGVPISREQERVLLSRGESLLENGDVAAARLVFSYAAQRGSAPAMQALARSYDPKHLLKLEVYGVEPDRAEAAVWYERAVRYSGK